MSDIFTVQQYQQPFRRFPNRPHAPAKTTVRPIDNTLGMTVSARSAILLYGALLIGFNLQCADGENCEKLSLKISDKVRHRPPHLTIAHRGAAAHLPEHTLAGYRLALELGADFVEPDLLATADGQLIALHSMDLSVATDVATKFPDRQPWYSPQAGQTGYWAFNFTAAEIATLRVRQTGEGRTNGYDYLWGVPTLSDVMQTVIQWNTVDLPKRLPVEDTKPDTAPNQPRKPSQLQLKQAGIYAELKDTQWLQEEAGISLVDLLVQHAQQQPDLWQAMLPCFDELQFDAFKVPGILIQSFDPQALADFSAAWRTNQSPSTMPEPPYVLLVDKDQCQEEEFWFRVGDTSRELISGIGCNKECLIANEPYTLTSTKAKEYSLQIHAWTERPEAQYVVDRFADEMDEMAYLYCEVGIQGVFSESVSTAVTAAMLPCPNKKKHTQGTNAGNENSSQYCYESEEEAGFFTALAAFTMGVFVTSLFFVGYGRHCMRWQSTVVPSSALEDGAVPSDMELHRHAENSYPKDTSSEEDHFQNTAARVDAWRSEQLAAAAAVIEEQENEGLELT